MFLSEVLLPHHIILGIVPGYYSAKDRVQRHGLPQCFPVQHPELSRAHPVSCLGLASAYEGAPDPMPEPPRL